MEFIFLLESKYGGLYYVFIIRGQKVEVGRLESLGFFQLLREFMGNFDYLSFYFRIYKGVEIKKIKKILEL